MSAGPVRLGLRENWEQFALLVVVNAFVGGMVGLERTVVPLLAKEEFGRASTTVALSFIVSFGNLEMSLFLIGPGRTTLPIAILQYLEWRIDPTIAAVSFLQIALIGSGMVLTDRYVKLAKVL